MTAQKSYRLGFIGAGKLAGSVVRGLMRAKFCQPGEIIASEPNEQTRVALQKESGVSVTAENAEIAEKAELVFIGVKPAMVLPVLGLSTGGLTVEGAQSKPALCNTAVVEDPAEALGQYEAAHLKPKASCLRTPDCFHS